MKIKDFTVLQLGTMALETSNTKGELKAIGGIPGYIHELVKSIQKRDIKVGLIGKIYNYDEKSKIKYFEIQKEAISTNHTLVNLFLKSWFLKIPKNSIIHGHRPDNLAIFKLFRNKHSIITLHGQQAKTVKDRKGFIVRTIYSILEQFTLKKVDVIIAVDKVTKAYYTERYPSFSNKIIVIPTGVDMANFKPLDRRVLRENFNLKLSDRIILYVGRIEPPKKIREMILAAKILIEKDSSIYFLLAGDGALKKEMEELVESLGLSNNIRFLGLIKRVELPRIFNMANLTVLYSGNEGSPLSVKESLACGIPVVANNVGDIGDIIVNGSNGYIVKNESIESLAKDLLLGLENAKNMRDNCIRSVSDFDIDTVNQKVIDVYESIINE